MCSVIVYMYMVHISQFKKFIRNLYATGNYKIVRHICSMYIMFEFFAFELTIDFGILICTFATGLVIFVFRLITLEQ